MIINYLFQSIGIKQDFYCKTRKLTMVPWDKTKVSTHTGFEISFDSTKFGVGRGCQTVTGHEERKIQGR